MSDTPLPAPAFKALRHDLKNALSPAMLCADALTSHPDETVRQNAALIVSSLEKARKLLKASMPAQ